MGVFSTLGRGDFMINVGRNMEYCEGVQYCRGYQDTRGEIS